CGFKQVQSTEATNIVYRKKYEDGSIITLTVASQNQFLNLNRSIEIDMEWKSHDHTLYKPIVKNLSQNSYDDASTQYEYIAGLHAALLDLGVEDYGLTLLRKAFRCGESDQELLGFISTILREKCGFSRVNDEGMSFLK